MQMLSQELLEVSEWCSLTYIPFSFGAQDVFPGGGWES